MNVIEFILSDKFAYIYIAAFIGFIIGEIYERGRKK